MRTVVNRDRKTVAVTWDGTVEDAIHVLRWGLEYGVEVEICTDPKTAEIFLQCQVPLGRPVRVNSNDALVAERILNAYNHIYVVRGKGSKRGTDK